jgi:hypothetical protein
MYYINSDINQWITRPGTGKKPQPPPYRQEPAPITVHKVSNHVYEVRGGSGANCAFIVGDNPKKVGVNLILNLQF